MGQPMENLPAILICDDDPAFHLAVKQALRGSYRCQSAYHGEEALCIIRQHAIDVLLLDIQMRAPDEGLKYIPAIREADPDLSIVMSSGLTDFRTVREALRLGAADYVAKDFESDELRHVIERVTERRRFLQKHERQNFEAESHQRQHVLIGESPAIIELRRLIERMRLSPANVLITGETGTGKEVVARQLRRHLPDGSLAPFVAVDSATIQSTTAESILFGHEKGAFTGADRLRKGIFEEAQGGIVYFDEIGNMPLEIQAKLLRVLQEKEVARMGSFRSIKLDFRVVCATNRNPEAEAQAGRFKDDLLQRLNVLPIHLPPLRERRSDIPILFDYFIRKQPGPIPRLKFTSAAMAALEAYPWPGNIRELANLVAYLVTMSDGGVIDRSDLPSRISSRQADGESANLESQSFYERVGGFERTLLQAEYRRAGMNISQLAVSLKMDRSHLYTKLREHGIHPNSSKSASATA